MKYALVIPSWVELVAATARGSYSIFVDCLALRIVWAQPPLMHALGGVSQTVDHALATDSVACHTDTCR